MSPPGRLFHVGLIGTLVLTALATVTVFRTGVHRLAHPAAGDFGVFYAAGKLLDAGRPLAVYSTSQLQLVERHISAGRTLNLFFPYPPYVTAVFGGLARLPLDLAFLVWTGANVLAYLGCCFMVLRRLPGQWRVAGSITAALSLPILVSTFQGENGGLTALGFTLALMALYPLESTSPTSERSRLLQLGAGVILLALKPQFLIVPLILVLARRKKPEIMTSGLSLIAALGAGVLAGGLASYASFANLLVGGLKAGSKYHWGPSFNYTFQAQVQALFGRSLLSTGLWVTIALLALGLLAWMAAERDDIVWIVPAAVAILATTHAMYHDLPLLFPALLVALSSDKLRWPALLTVLAIVLDPLLYPVSHVHLLVFALTGAAVVGGKDAAQRAVRTMRGYRLEAFRTGLWRLFEPRRWGSASGSETPLR